MYLEMHSLQHTFSQGVLGIAYLNLQLRGKTETF